MERGELANRSGVDRTGLFAMNGLIVSRVSPPLRSPRGGAARRAISRSTRPAWSAKQKDYLPLVRPFGKECLSPLSLVRCHAPNIRFPFTADFFLGSGSFYVQAHVHMWFRRGISPARSFQGTEGDVQDWFELDFI